MSGRVRAQLNSSQLRNRLKLRSLASETKLLQAHPEAKKFYERLGLRPGRIREHAARIMASGALAGTLLLSAHSAVPVQGQRGQLEAQKNEVVNLGVLQDQLGKTLQEILPAVGNWVLNRDQEEKISEEIEKMYGVKAVAELEGNRLNNSYGRMGAEQHLPRYPGDTVYEHRDLIEKGITPGLGGWGYFAPSRNQMTPELVETEKWYVAVQTLYLPDWNIRTEELAKWYKYRHVLVVNPANGKAVVAAVADAGPAAFTGKHFGGSPEVMQYLGINYGKQNHPVVLFFVDDPNKEIPLGPLEYNVEAYKSQMAYSA